ncbi:MAG TPA: hypothetical protein VGF48_20145 [Thermoanaerobaculia bacterium]|jgi:hypothetical protein
MRFVAVSGYAEVVAELGDSDEVNAARLALLTFAQTYPDRGKLVPDTSVRVVKTRSHPGYAALRLFYRVEGEVLYLLELAPYDELDDDDFVRKS